MLGLSLWGPAPSSSFASSAVAPWDISRTSGLGPRRGFCSLGYSLESALVSTNSSKRPVVSVVLKGAAEAGLFAFSAATLACVMMAGPGQAASVAQGAAAAWLASTAGTAWMIWAREVSARAFWWAFGGGFFLRLAVLGGLFFYAQRATGVWTAELLVTYAAGVFLMLLIEYRHINLR